MAIQCPKCRSENSETAKFCSECATPLHPSKEIGVTKTIETPIESFTRGTTLAGRYEVIEKLGAGGMGSVYRVEDKKIGHDIALKIIKPEIASDKKTIERFRNELKTTRMISHRNVCRMFDIGESEGTHFITMEYIPGEDLKNFIRRVGQLPSGKAISIAKQVCEGLAEAHRLGVVHRDLKSNNIMIDKDGSARIMDFGIARSIRTKGLTGEGIIIGTPEYMSPEQAEAKEVDHLSDIYSLGVIIYEMVTGRLPFEGGTPLSIAMKHKGEIPQDPKELNPQISDDLNRMILSCMEKDKENRYQSAEEVHAELTKLEKGIPTTEKVIPARKPLTSREITVTLGLKKILIPAFVVIGISIVGILLWKLLPQKHVELIPKIENSIAVVSFENLTGDKAYDDLCKATSSLLITKLEGTDFFHVATWERMRDLLKQMGKEDVEFIDSDLGFELCQREGIESLITGRITKAGEMFAIDVKALDVGTMDLSASASSQGEGEDSIIRTQIDELSNKISQGLGIAKQKIEATKLKVADVTTFSMEAYNYFLKGKEDRERFYFENAIQSFEKAIELDPKFAVAYLYLAFSYSQTGNTKASDDAYKKAKTLSKNATDKERLYIDAYYAQRIEGDGDRYFRILKEITEKYPKEKEAHYYLARHYRAEGQYDKAIEEFQKTLELDPKHGRALNSLALTYLTRLENFEKAIEYFEKYVGVSPREPNPINSIGWTFFLMGKIDEAVAKFKEALEIKPDFLYSNWSLAYTYALQEEYDETMKLIDQYIALIPSKGEKAQGHYWKAFYLSWLGRFDLSLSELRKAEDLFKEIENVNRVSQTEEMRGWVYFDRGELESSLRHLKKWFDYYLENSSDSIRRYRIYFNFYLGLQDLKKGEIDSAKSRLVEMKSDLSSIDQEAYRYPAFHYNVLYGEILLAEGSVDEAIALLKETSPLGRPPVIQNIITYNVPFLKDVLARAYQQKGDLDMAITEYEKLITFDPKSKERLLIHPRYHYRLAKLYEQKGWEGKAIEHYEKFLSLWKNADPGIVEVEDARKRLAGLRRQ